MITFVPFKTLYIEKNSGGRKLGKLLPETFWWICGGFNVFWWI